MRKFALAISALVCSFGLAIAADVVFVKFDKDKKELTVTEDGKEVTYKITDKTVFKNASKDGDKEVPAEKAMIRLEKAKEGKTKFSLTGDKGVATEIKFPEPKKKN